MNALTVPNGVAVALFGIALSAAFCDIQLDEEELHHIGGRLSSHALDAGAYYL